MMSLLTGKYAALLFGAIGAVALLALLILVIKKIITYKKEAKTAAESLEKIAPKKKAKSQYAEVFNNIQRRGKNGFLPSFLCVYEGSIDQGLAYLSQLVNIDTFDITLIDTSQAIAVGHNKIIILTTLESVKEINAPLFDETISKLYRRSIIQMPIVLLKTTTNEYASSQFAPFQKFLAQLQVFSKNPYQIHLSVRDSEVENDVEVFYDLLKYNTELPLYNNTSKDEIKTHLAKQFAEMRERLSLKLSDPNCDIQAIQKALSAAGNFEVSSLPAAQLLSDLALGAYGQAPAFTLTVNLGIDGRNYHSSFFEAGSRDYKRAIKPRHIIAAIIVIISISLCAIFGYNAYQKYQFDNYLKTNQPFTMLDMFKANEAEKTYNLLANRYHNQLILPFLYHPYEDEELNRRYVTYLTKNVLIPKFYQSQNRLHKAILLALIANTHSQKISDAIHKNIKLISIISGLNESQVLLVYQYRHENGKLLADIPASGYATALDDDYKDILSSSNIESGKLFSSLFTGSYVNATNSQLREFIGHNVLGHQEICVVQQVTPSMLLSSSVSNSENTAKFLTDLSSALPQNLNDCNNSTTLIDLQNVIPSTDSSVTTFSDIVDQLTQYNKKIVEFFNQHNMDHAEEQSLKRVLLNTELNTILAGVLDSSQGTIKLLDEKNFYPNTFNTALAKSPTTISLAYSKNTITNTVLPLIKHSDEMVKTLQQYNVDSSVLNQLKKDALKGYVAQYVDTLNQALTNALPGDVTADNLQIFLLDVTSDNTPFSNMLLYIKNNTTFDPKAPLPPELQPITDNFSQLDAFIGSDKYKTYKNTLTTLGNTLSQKNRDDYLRLYTQISSSKGDSPLAQLNTLIDSLGITNLAAYQLLKAPAQIIRDSLVSYLVDDLGRRWEADVVPKISLIQSKFPLDFSSSTTISSDDLAAAIGPQGSVYGEMFDLMKNFITLDKVSNRWIISDDLTPSQQLMLVKYLRSLNYFYALQHMLWGNDGKPLSISVFVQAKPFAHVSLDGAEKMVLSFLQIGDKARVLGLNTDDQGNYSLEYNWQLQPTVSVGWLSNTNVSHQKTFQGDWALFTMLASATCNDNWLCNWQIKGDNAKVPPYVVSFQLKANILDFLKSQAKNGNIIGVQ